VDTVDTEVADEDVERDDEDELEELDDELNEVIEGTILDDVEERIADGVEVGM